MHEQLPPLRRNRDFQLLWIGQAASALGSRASTVAYPLLVLTLTGSPADAGIVGFAATIPYLVLQLPAGVVVDRVDRRRAMIGCDAGRLTILAGVAAAVATGHASFPLIAAAALAEGCLTVIFNLAELSAIQLLVPSEQLEAALAQNEVRVRGAGLAGQRSAGSCSASGGRCRSPPTPPRTPSRSSCLRPSGGRWPQPRRADAGIRGRR